MALRLRFGLIASGLAATCWFAISPVESHPRIRTTLLWTKDIAPILQRRCYHCHTDGNIAMSLATYREGRPWAAAIREEALTRRMPPWSAVAGFGHFANDASLTQREIDVLVAWADGGAPSGQTLQEEALPALYVPSAPGWQSGDPDIVLKPGSTHEVAAGAAPHVARFDVPTGFTTAERIGGLAFQPGDRRVVRYAAVYEKGSGRWLFTWTPWQTGMRLPDGAAFVLPAGAVLTLEVAYRGTDEAVTATGEIGLYRADGAAKPAIVRTVAMEKPRTLAPGAPPLRARAELVLEETVTIAALWPEAGPEAQSMELTAIHPDGRVEPMLWLEHYRTDFRSPYLLADPLTLPKGARLLLTVYLANSAGEPVTAEPRLSFVSVPTTSSTLQGP